MTEPNSPNLLTLIATTGQCPECGKQLVSEKFIDDGSIKIRMVLHALNIPHDQEDCTTELITSDDSVVPLTEIRTARERAQILRKRIETLRQELAGEGPKYAHELKTGLVAAGLAAEQAEEYAEKGLVAEYAGRSSALHDSQRALERANLNVNPISLQWAATQESRRLEREREEKKARAVAKWEAKQAAEAQPAAKPAQKAEARP